MQRNTEFLRSLLYTPLLLAGWTLQLPYPIIRKSGHIALIADTVCTTCFRAQQKIPLLLSNQQQQGNCAYSCVGKIRHLPATEGDPEAGRSSGRLPQDNVLGFGFQMKASLFKVYTMTPS